MHSFAKLSLFFGLFRAYVYAQTTTALYVPSISNTGGINDGGFLEASFQGIQNGQSVYQLILGTVDDGDNGDGGDDGDDIPTPTLTLTEASTTAHLFGAVADEGITMSIDIKCSINGETSSCEETALVLVGSSTASSSVSTFTESVSPVPVTLVGSLPSSSTTPQTSPAPVPSSTPGSASGSTGGSSSSSSSSNSPAGSNPAPAAPSSGSSPAAVPSPTAGLPTNSNSSGPTTLNPANSASPFIMTISMFVLPLAIFARLF